MDRWSEWLQELEALDPEDPAWETAPRFLQQLQELLARKEQVRQLRTRLNHLRQRLERELAGEIHFLKLDLRIPDEPSPEAFQTLEALCEALAEHARIREQLPKAPTLEALEELTHRLRELAQEIRRMAGTLLGPEEPRSLSPMRLLPQSRNRSSRWSRKRRRRSRSRSQRRRSRLPRNPPSSPRPPPNSPGWRLSGLGWRKAIFRAPTGWPGPLKPRGSPRLSLPPSWPSCRGFAGWIETGK